ncbi:hypothetical protein [Spirosoma telluris]|uniref:hypothetical protein n=1 Tax=Spirosoma telluris TaxID=2183553 RepID=UPI002FC3C73B
MRKLSFPFSLATGCTLLGGLLVAACQDHRIPAVLPLFSEAANPAVLATSPNGTVIYNGGFGSAIAQDPNDPTAFYLLTDRGPNAGGSVANSIIFGKADFTPQIGRFRAIGNQLILERTILLKNSAGQLLTGLPNPVGQGNTGRLPLT